MLISLISFRIAAHVYMNQLFVLHNNHYLHFLSLFHVVINNLLKIWKTNQFRTNMFCLLVIITNSYWSCQKHHVLCLCLTRNPGLISSFLGRKQTNQFNKIKTEDGNNLCHMEVDCMLRNRMRASRRKTRFQLCKLSTCYLFKQVMRSFQPIQLLLFLFTHSDWAAGTFSRPARQ